MSALPSPGGHRDGWATGQLRTLQPLTDELIATVLLAGRHTVHTDEAGALVSRWDDTVIGFGRQDGLLRVRTTVGPPFSIEDASTLRSFGNAWNRDRLWPTAYVHVDDVGAAWVRGDLVADLAGGVTCHQLDQLLGRGISTGRQLATAVALVRR